MCRCRAGKLRRVLARARQADGIGLLDQGATRRRNRPCQRHRRQIGVHHDAALGAGNGVQTIGDSRWRQLRRQLCQIGLGLDTGLAFVEKNIGLAIRIDDGAGKRMRRVRHIVAANIENPGNGRRICHQQCIGSLGRHRLCQRGDLFLRQLAGEGFRLDDDRLQRF
ncbi:hypothetical protein D3C87_1252580 [compost metagenome]